VTIDERDRPAVGSCWTAAGRLRRRTGRGRGRQLVGAGVPEWFATKRGGPVRAAAPRAPRPTSATSSGVLTGREPRSVGEFLRDHAGRVRSRVRPDDRARDRPPAARALLRPGDRGYDEGRAAWNRTPDQEPAAVVMAEDAVTSSPGAARPRRGRGVAVMATGTARRSPATAACWSTLSRMSGVRVAGRTRIARVACRGEVGRPGPVAASTGSSGAARLQLPGGHRGYTWAAASAGWAGATGWRPGR
jgi:hypothetical protein